MTNQAPIPEGRDDASGARDADGPFATVMKVATWRVLGAVFIAAVIVGLWFGVSPFAALGAPIVIFILFPELAGMSSRVRRERGSVILSYLEQAVRLNLPLVGMIRAARQSESRETAERLYRLETRLEDGDSLAGSLRRATPEIGARAIALIESAERVGRLPQTLARLVDERTATPDAAGFEEQRMSFGRWYPVMMTLLLGGIVSMIMVFVVPKMEEIFKDFGMRLPSQTRLLLSIARDSFGGDVPLVLIVIMAVSAILLGRMFVNIFAGPPLLPRVGVIDAALWYTPVSHAVARDRGLADACDVIAGALRAGQPLHRAIQETTTLRVNAVLRGRLQKWALGVEAGGRADDAARRAGLPPLLCGMIGAGGGGGRGDVAPAMEFLESYYAARFSRTRELLHAAAVPAMTLFFGAIVLFVATALFMPLLHLIDLESRKI